jgi:hypothetical protein
MNCSHLRYIVWFAGLLLTSCEKELGYDLPYEGDRFVVYGVLSPDEIVSVQITKTYPPTGKYLFEDIDYATVALYEDSIFVENLRHQGKGVYVSASKRKPETGKSYFVRVTAEGFPEAVTRPEKIPVPVRIDEYDFSEKISSIRHTDYPTRKLTFTFTDDPATEDYYTARVLGFHQQNKVHVEAFSGDRPAEAEDVCGFTGDDEFSLRDVCFSGLPYTLNIGVETRGNEQPSGQKKDCDRMVLTLKRSNYTHYEYLRTYYNEEGFLQVFYPPRPRYTNVIGGYGILAAYSETRVELLK